MGRPWYKIILETLLSHLGLSFVCMFYAIIGTVRAPYSGQSKCPLNEKKLIRKLEIRTPAKFTKTRQMALNIKIQNRSLISTILVIKWNSGKFNGCYWKHLFGSYVKRTSGDRGETVIINCFYVRPSDSRSLNGKIKMQLENKFCYW